MILYLDADFLSNHNVLTDSGKGDIKNPGEMMENDNDQCLPLRRSLKSV